MELRDVAQRLNLGTGEKGRGETYVINLRDYDDFGKVQSKLDRNQDVEEQGENALVTKSGTSLLYSYEDEEGSVYQINLLGDAEADTARVVITLVDDHTEEE